MSWSTHRPGGVDITLQDGSHLIGREVRFTTERCGWRRRPTEVCYLTGQDGGEQRIGPIRELRFI